jgi:hypothetical protein
VFTARRGASVSLRLRPVRDVKVFFFLDAIHLASLYMRGSILANRPIFFFLAERSG